MDGKCIRSLGLALLVAIGLSFVGASTAQAKWLLLQGGTSVSSLNLKATIPLVKVLVPSPGIDQHCNTGTATITLSVSGDQKTLNGSGTATFSGCSHKEFEETCEIGSTGQPSGTIVMSGSGVGGVGEGKEEYFVELTSSKFTNIEYRGAECPLAEIDGTVAGKLRIHTQNALADTLSKSGPLLDTITYGGSQAYLHDGAMIMKPVKVTAEEANGNKWGLHTIDL